MNISRRPSFPISLTGSQFQSACTSHTDVASGESCENNPPTTSKAQFTGSASAAELRLTIHRNQEQKWISGSRRSNRLLDLAIPCRNKSSRGDPLVWRLVLGRQSFHGNPRISMVHGYPEIHGYFMVPKAGWLAREYPTLRSSQELRAKLPPPRIHDSQSLESIPATSNP